MSDKKFDVNGFLEHIKRYFEYQKTLEGMNVPARSDEFLEAENIYLHISCISNKESILKNGLLLNKSKECFKGREEKSQNGVIFVSKSWGGYIPPQEEESEVIVFIIDANNLTSESVDYCRDDIWIYSDVGADRILGWFSYSPFNYSEGVKTSIDDDSEIQ